MTHHLPIVVKSLMVMSNKTAMPQATMKKSLVKKAVVKKAQKSAAKPVKKRVTLTKKQREELAAAYHENGGGTRAHACTADKKKACVADFGCSWRKKTARSKAHCTGGLYANSGWHQREKLKKKTKKSKKTKTP